MAKGLTKRQADILHYIVNSIRDDGMPPTIAEIGVRFSISSTNGVNDHLLALEKEIIFQFEFCFHEIQRTQYAPEINRMT